MDIKAGDYVTLKPWEEVADGNALGIGESVWNDLCKKPRKVLDIDNNPKYDTPLFYLIECKDRKGKLGYFVLEEAIASVRRDQ